MKRNKENSEAPPSPVDEIGWMQGTVIRDNPEGVLSAASGTESKAS